MKYRGDPKKGENNTVTMRWMAQSKATETDVRNGIRSQLFSS